MKKRTSDYTVYEKDEAVYWGEVDDEEREEPRHKNELVYDEYERPNIMQHYNGENHAFPI